VSDVRATTVGATLSASPAARRRHVGDPAAAQEGERCSRCSSAASCVPELDQHVMISELLRAHSRRTTTAEDHVLGQLHRHPAQLPGLTQRLDCAQEAPEDRTSAAP
jgi:hypothetical protein